MSKVQEELTVNELPKVMLKRGNSCDGPYWYDKDIRPTGWTVEVYPQVWRSSWAEAEIQVWVKEVDPDEPVAVVYVKGQKAEILEEAQTIGAALLWSALRSWWMNGD